jgi:uncharacterized membrane protein YcjF (UPF0283 family)
LLLIVLECLVCLLLWWGGVAFALSGQSEDRSRDMIQRRRRTEWLRNELEQRPWWWLMLSGLMFLVLVDWFMDKWEQRAWRAAILWTMVMIIVLAAVVSLTDHFGWGVRPIKL